MEKVAEAEMRYKQHSVEKNESITPPIMFYPLYRNLINLVNSTVIMSTDHVTTHFSLSFQDASDVQEQYRDSKEQRIALLEK